MKKNQRKTLNICFVCNKRNGRQAADRTKIVHLMEELTKQ